MLEVLNFHGFQNYTSTLPGVKILNKYLTSKMMAPHADHIHSIFDGQKKGIPIISMLGVLNEDYEGGEFIMFDDEVIKLKQGDLLIFPSIFLFPHKVNAVTKGTRYSFISWGF